MQRTDQRSAADHQDGSDASRRAIGAADYHPLSVWRSAPAIKRMQQTIPSASKLASGLAPDPQRIIRKNGIKQMLLIGQAGWHFEQHEQEMKTLTYRAF